ncbi:MAG: hypothetical protein IJ468_10820 [Lachnospiraceae bacterium]|nr:hypothetical protein [Lachnospiraceae bacterium]
MKKMRMTLFGVGLFVLAGASAVFAQGADTVSYDWYDSSQMGELPTGRVNVVDGELSITDTGDYYVLKLSDDDWDQVTYIEQQVYLDDGEGYVEAGFDNLYEWDDDGNLIISSNFAWLALDGQFAPYYVEADGYLSNGDWYTYGYVPAEMDGDNIEIIVCWEGADGDPYVAGWRYEDTSLNPSTTNCMYRFNSNDSVRIWGSYYDYDGDFEGNYYFGDSLQVGLNGLEVSYEDTGVDRLMVWYMLGDSSGNFYYTETAEYARDSSNGLGSGSGNGSGSEQASESELENAMTAVVNGESCTFELVKAQMNSNGKQMNVIFEAYNPRGNRMHQIELVLDENLAPGQYFASDNYDNGVCIWVNDQNYQARGPKPPYFGSKGSFTFSLTERSSDWSEYRGTFSASAVGVDGTTGTVTIEDASFHFTFPFAGSSSGGSSYSSGSSSYSSGGSYSSGFDWDDDSGSSGTTCYSCSGTGRCQDCGGTGKRETQKESINLGSGSSKYTVTQACYTCSGSRKCIWCKGDGITGN